MSAASSPPRAKLQPPLARPGEVHRAAVAQRIVQAASARLVLVRAPAGFGKTTAMQQARQELEDAGLATAWLTLDRADNDLPRFLGALAAAVAPLGIDAQRAGSGPAGLLAALTEDAAPFVLFVDDAELIQEPAVLGLLREVVERLPRQGRVVLGSRSLPDLGLGRLRARGQLVEIDAALLRFTLAESAEFFRLRGLNLPGAALERLHARTEGWIAALWLAAMALERHGVRSDFVERFSGTDRTLADYLGEDVLAHQPAERREFLLRTSILRHLSAPACRALVPGADAERLLQELEAANLFLMPVAGDEGAYRYHSLFADFLRAQLGREHPDEVARLHLAASGWYETEGRPVPAIDHAIEGGDHPHAMHLLEQHAEAFLEQGRMRLLDRWFSALPAERLRSRPRLQVVAVWAACFTRGPWSAMSMLQASACGASDDAAVQAHVNALQPLLLAMMDRHEEADARGREALARLPSARPFADTVLLNAMAHIVSVRGEQREAHRLLDAARRSQAGGSFNRMYTESMEGVLDLKEARLRQATARLRIAVSAAPHAAAYTLTHGNAWAGVLYASVVFESDDLDAAEQLLNVYLPLARDVGLPDHMIVSHRLLARIAFERGDVDAALQTLTELEYLGHARQLPRVVASARLERSRLAVLQGNLAAARHELARADDAAVWQRVRGQYLLAHEVDDLAIAGWRIALAGSEAAAARPPLEAALAEAEHAQRGLRALKLRLLRALSRHAGGDTAGALDDLAMVLQTASREGFVRLVLDEGPLAAALLQRARALAASASPPAALAEPLVAELLQRLLARLGVPAVAEEAEPAMVAGPLAEPLTRKEIRVLQLLAEGYSNSAMAEKLFVSDSTVRTHLRNINLKLGAHSRTQAVALARRAGVIR